MRRFHDMHKGQRIWVCGTGPSLLLVDETRLHPNDIIIACNSAVMHFANADYMIWVDGEFGKADDCIEILANLRPTQKCINLNPLVRSPNRFTAEIFHQSQNWGDWKIRKTRHFPGNVTHRAVSFAFAMGAREVILAGCDCQGHHPYHPEADKLVQPFEEDLYLWQMMKETNPNLPIYSISHDSKICFDKVDINTLYVDSECKN